MVKLDKIPDKVYLGSNPEPINPRELPIIGAGHDGIVFRLHDSALKVLKYDICFREEKNLMTFEKALYFIKNLNLRMITQPSNIILDPYGKYAGYVMEYVDDISDEKAVGSFTTEELRDSILAMSLDFQELSENKVEANDLNRYSYLYAKDFLHLCDTDKYKIGTPTVSRNNENSLRYVYARLLYFLMSSDTKLERRETKDLCGWVKKSTNSSRFLHDLIRESEDFEFIGDLALQKRKSLIKR